MGEFSAEDNDKFYLTPQVCKSDLIKMWGTELENEKDVWRVFSRYYSGIEVWDHLVKPKAKKLVMKSLTQYKFISSY